MKKAFTVIEILTVVIIIAILATLAIPPFIKTMDSAKGRLAKTNLKLILAAEKVYRNETGKYMPYLGGERTASDEDFKKYLGLEIKDKNFTYKVIGGDTFTGIAEYTGTRYPGAKITIREDGTIESQFPPSP